ncbi:uncharacterized protein LOC110459006 [Mizuhopecten yessoensis]|uniref:uncharacterized protein LOC110459006 n=1 Tax=Mizuhopecten yessoensis TaxID=6573 RepID=UPI000B458077|nr:uncharacterized protein LOC110459006 [Mizuhopecten yessoensis]
MQMVHASAYNCSEATQGPLHGLGAAVHASIAFSGVCAEELMICDPTSALDCGIEASREILANISMDKLEENLCRIYDQSMECVERNTYACPQEVNWKVQEKMETSFCISYDMIKHCPSVRKEMARDSTKIPSCDADSWMEDMREDMDVKNVTTRTENGTTVINRNTTRANNTAEMMDDYKVCNLTGAYGCLSHLGMKLMSPMMQCNSMHRQYTKTMQCVDKMTSWCDSSTMSVVESVVRMAVKTVYKMCPQVVMKPCQESKHCRLDEAQHCVDVLAHMSSMKEMKDQHICLAREMTEICLKEKLQHCSVFGKSAMMEAVKHATPNRHLVCGGDLEVCIQKFFFNTIGLINGDVMLAQATRIRNTIASEVTSHFMENPYMVGVTEINRRIEMNLANMSRAMREMLSGGANMSMMPDAMQMDNMGDAYLMDGVAYMWGMISGGMEEDYQTNHAKAKVIQCAAVREAYECMDSEMHMASWSYLSSAQGTFVRQNLIQLHEVSKSMCHEDMTCTFLKQPESCQVLPAMWMTMAGVGQVLTTNNAAFCSNLPSMMSNISALTSSCTDDVGQHFKAMLGFQEEAKEAICNLPSNCNVDGATACLLSLNKDNFCAEYDNVKNCMTGALKSCAVMVQANLTAELENVQNAYGQSCIKMPSIYVTDPTRLIRLEEGSMNSTNIYVTMTESPSCGNNCHIEVTVSLSEVASSVAKCADGAVDIPQVLVVKDGDTSGTCNMVFTDADYMTPRVVPLLATADLIQDGTHYITAKLTATKIDNGVVVKETQLAEYQIVVTNNDRYSACMAFGDSVRSFDGLSHNNYYQGLFLVYKHTILPQEVFVLKQKSLNRFGTESCAVAVKSEDDVFIIDRCRESNGNIRNTQQLYMTGTLHPFTEINSEGSKYTVRFPSGTVVTIEDMTISLQIMVHASPFDMGHTTGLCGVYDGMTDNDLTLPNGRAIAIATSTASVDFATSRDFDRQWSASSSDLFLKSSDFPTNTFCSCGSNAGSSSPPQCVSRNTLVDSCASPLAGTDITNALKEGAAVIVTGCDRKRRQAGTGLFDGVEIDPTYDDSVTEPTWNQTRTYNLDLATAFCQQQVNAKAVISLCQQIPGFSLPTDTVIQECIDKIKLTDSAIDATYTLAVYIGQCESEARQLLGSTDITLVQLATNILNFVCPNDCSGSNGICSAGTCQCQQSWLGVDCSIDGNQPPTVSSVENNGLCPLGSTDCAVITVLGDNFSDQKTPSCHFQALTINQAGTTTTGPVQIVVAEYVTITQINCPVPADMMTSSLKSAVQVAVSNDGAKFSPYYTVVTFDSACYSCSTTACTTTTTGCVIENVCYEAFSNKPGDQCHYCDPSLTNTGWTMKIAPPLCNLPTTPAPPTTSSQPAVTTTTTTRATTPRPTTPKPTTPRPTTPRPTTTPTTPAPMVKTTTEEPVLSQDAQLIVVVLGVVAGLFAVLSCILAVKYCQRQP